MNEIKKFTLIGYKISYSGHTSSVNPKFINSRQFSGYWQGGYDCSAANGTVATDRFIPLVFMDAALYKPILTMFN